MRGDEKISVSLTYGRFPLNPKNILFLWKNLLIFQVKGKKAELKRREKLYINVNDFNSNKSYSKSNDNSSYRDLHKLNVST